MNWIWYGIAVFSAAGGGFILACLLASAHIAELERIAGEWKLRAIAYEWYWRRNHEGEGIRSNVEGR